MDAPVNFRSVRALARPRARALRVLARPLWILAVCALIVTLRLGREALIPVALAVLIALVLSGVVEALRRYHIPRGFSAVVLLMIVAVAVSGVVEMLWTPAQQWIESAPRVLRTIELSTRSVLRSRWCAASMPSQNGRPRWQILIEVPPLHRPPPRAHP